MSSVEKVQSEARYHLATLSQEPTNDPEEIQRLVKPFAHAILTALQVGLTPNEIRAACREGRGTNTQVILEPSLDPEYWLSVYAEAEAFWASRSGFTDSETSTD